MVGGRECEAYTACPWREDHHVEHTRALLKGVNALLAKFAGYLAVDQQQNLAGGLTGPAARPIISIAAFVELASVIPVPDARSRPR